MQYEKINVNAFAGADLNKRAEMIDNSQASDIENLRFDKVGYLINRNGVQGKPLRMVKSETVDFTKMLWPIGAMGMTEYILKAPWGPGSGTTSVAPYDDATINSFFQSAIPRFSDKFMVSAIRIPAFGIQSGSAATSYSDWYNDSQRDSTGFPQSPANHYTWRYKAAYVIMPLYGPSDFRDTFAILPNGFPLTQTQSGLVPDLDYPSAVVTVGARSILRADDKPGRTQIYAPVRWLGVHNTFEHENNPKDQNWIEHYVSMGQYRDSIIISDMTNKDLQLVDEYSEAEYSEERKHRFTLRENALAKFDVDDVIIDFGIGENKFNNEVEAPMALYKFFLPRSPFETTNDNYGPTFVGASESPTYKDVTRKYEVENNPSLFAASSDYKDYWVGVNYVNTSSFMTTEFWDEDSSRLPVVLDAGGAIFWRVAGSAVSFDTVKQYTFTNNADNTDYDNLLGKLTLKNPAILKDDQVSADVYLWEDMLIKYYPCSGINNTNTYFLSDRDRSWNKTSSTAPKLIKLKTKKGVEQDVPLGVWRYRFIWYMGNGEYSAPSSELVVPDLIFSAIKDSDITQTGITYTRPIGIDNQSDAEKTNIELQYTNFLNKDVSLQHLKMFSGNSLQLTEFGKSFIKIKEKLYDPDHLFAAAKTTTNGVSWPDVDAGAWTNQSILAKGQVAVTCTLKVDNNTLTMQGTFGESAYSKLDNAWRPRTIVNATNYILGEGKLKVLEYSAAELKLNVVLFSDSNENSYSYNSLFTDIGCIRTAYKNTPKYSTNPYYSSAVPSYQIISEGKHRYGIAYSESYTGSPSLDDIGLVNEIISKGSRIFLNVVPFQTPYDPSGNTDRERNNEDDDIVYPSAGTTKRYEYRNMTIVRGIKNSTDRLLNLKKTVPPEVSNRIILRGYAEIEVCDFGDRGTWTPQKTQYNNYQTFQNPVPSYTDDLLDRYIKYDNTFAYSRKFTDLPALTVAAAGNHDSNFVKIMERKINVTIQDYVSFKPIAGTVAQKDTIEFRNLRVVASFPGERLTIAEQLSMYVPASLLFEAPHVKIVIPADRIPRRARQLMIFRTRASHDNAWQPHEYGLVKAIDVIRDSNTGKPTDKHLEKIEFLDDVKIEDMDFSYNISDYDGFVEPIRSRFCLPLNERVFYANIRESYKPHAPRNAVKITADPAKVYQVSHKNLNVGSLTEIERLWSYRFFTQDTATANITRRYLYYFLAYNDVARSYSLASFSGVIDRGDLQVGDNAKKKVMLYCLPSAYDTTVEHVNIYRLNVDAPLDQVPFGFVQGIDTYRRMSVNRYTTGVFYVAQGVVEYNGVVYYPNSVIKAFDGGDTGVPDDGTIPINIQGYLNRFVDYFSQDTAPYQYVTGIKNRGAQASYCEPIIYNVTSVFDGAAGPRYIEKIGDITPENEGVFYDDDLPALGRLPLLQFFQNEDVMPAGLRWSEPYQPNKLKLGSLMEVRSGDGDQITGMVQLYGNIVVLKERSMHRLAVQGAAVPVSRVDEISNNVGCIAPNTAITIDNTLYFLSWAGFYKYDNNVLSKIDGAFAEELQIRLRSNINGVSNPAIRDASCGWNPSYREIYLNIPVMSSENNEGHYNAPGIQGDHTQGITLMDNVGEREIRSVVYAINVDTGFVTKYRYMDDALYFTDPDGVNPYVPSASLNFLNAPTQRAPRVSGRLYYTNTLGQLRSSEILPPRTYNYSIQVKPTASDASISYLQTTFYIESPTKEANSSFDKYKDDLMMYTQTQSGSWQNALNFRNVRVFWASKSWTGDDKTMLKRIRKVYSYVSSSVQPVVIRGIVHTSPMGAKNTSDTVWEYSYYNDNSLSPAFGEAVSGELSAIPTEASGASTSASQNRGERHIFQVEGGGAFQMEYFGFYWKPVNPYER